MGNPATASTEDKFIEYTDSLISSNNVNLMLNPGLSLVFDTNSSGEVKIAMQIQCKA